MGAEESRAKGTAGLGPFGGRMLVGPVFDHTVCAVDTYGP